MKRLNILFIAVITVFTLNSCCLVDHSKPIKKVAEPMLKELDVFYKKNKRYPTLKERDEILINLGCKMKDDICLFQGKEIHVASKIRSDNGYSFKMIIIRKEFSKTIGSCGFSYYKSKTDGPVICFSEACIKIRQ